MSNEEQDVLTTAGLKKLEEELEHLKLVRRREVAKRIRQAIDFGDISDSSEYEDAKNEQAFVEGRIITLEKVLRNAKIIDSEAVGTDEVGIGSTVLLKDLDGGTEFRYTIVGSMESEPGANKISHKSPVGQAVLGQQVGSVIEVQVPAGVVKYKIIDILR